jgi:hypothetical protein
MLPIPTVRDGKMSNWWDCETGTVRIEINCAAPGEASVAASATAAGNAALFMEHLGARKESAVGVYLRCVEGVTIGWAIQVASLVARGRAVKGEDVSDPESASKVLIT